MSFKQVLSSTLLLASAPLIHAIPLIVYPGGPADMVISKNTTLNATTPAGENYAPHFDPAGQLSLSFTNYMSGSVYAYVVGTDATGQLAFLSPTGNDFYYPTTTSTTPVEIDQADVAIPLGAQGATTQITIPGYLQSSRVYFSDGAMGQYVVAQPNGLPAQVQSDVGNPNDPNVDVNWAFMELNWAEASGLFADISAVDLVGLPLGITLEDANGSQSALGLTSTSVSDVCNALTSQAQADGQPWDQLCVLPSGSSDPLRVIAPQHYLESNANAFSGYFDDYVTQVYSTYSSTELVFDLSAQGDGYVSCTSSGTDLTCAGSSGDFPAPTDSQIFNCAGGPFDTSSSSNSVDLSIIPMLCAGFNRGTLLLGNDTTDTDNGWPASGSIQPSLPISSYYSGDGPYNWYSKIVHENEASNEGYAFPYDDVDSINGGGVAGTVSSANPTSLTVIVGGYDLA